MSKQAYNAACLKPLISEIGIRRVSGLGLMITLVGRAPAGGQPWRAADPHVPGLSVPGPATGLSDGPSGSGRPCRG
jgi:hypothetical protein